MLAWLFDIIIVVVLVFFAWRGAKKGLILTLCGLAGIFIAFFGARFVSSHFYEPVSNIIEPVIYQTISGAQEDQAPAPAGDGQGSDQTTLGDLLDIIRDADLFSGLTGFLEDAQDGDLRQTAGRTAAQALADYLSGLVAKAGLFAVSFLLILLLWFLVGHALDLAFHLPVLSAVNRVGGAIAGLIKAALLVIVLVWLGQLAGLVPAEPTTPVLSLFTLRRLGELLNRLLV